ncbi:MAG: glycine zipper 2TM domain-containing protein [Candidatus Omnitrophica bacterium]|jgi:outer membrane lipoprotein SlyB|nr:glycine zipper 2TM domain-containing protein [Candidatus Omnitrophota bacterium]
MKKNILINIGIISALALLTVGCTSNFSPGSYSQGQVMQSQSVQYGTIVSIAYVKIKGSSSPLGAIAGGVAGAAIGNTIGGGSGKTLATVAGAIGGAVAGNAIQKGVTQKPGLQIVVKLDNGPSIAVVQGIEQNVTFEPGERVMVITSPNGVARIQPLE